VARLFNTSLSTGCFPRKYGHAIVFPLLFCYWKRTTWTPANSRISDLSPTCRTSQSYLKGSFRRSCSSSWRTHHDAHQSVRLQEVSQYRDSIASALQRFTGCHWSWSSVWSVSTWSQQRRWTQSATNCCYFDSIGRLGSKVRPMNGSSPTCQAGRTALYKAEKHHHQLSKWPVPYRRVQYLVRCCLPCIQQT